MVLSATQCRLAGSLAATLVLLAAPAQDDLRDRVTRKNGKVVAGRVLVPTAPKELLVLQGGRRVRIPREDIRSVELLADSIREFCKRRLTHMQSRRAQWYLVEWAAARGMPGLARAQAMLLALDHAHEESHRYLGHRQASKGWLWPFQGRHLTRAGLEEAAAKRHFEIAGERFIVRCDGNIRAAVAALLDLEHLGVVFYERFAEDLQLEQTLRPIRVVISGSAGSFEKWGFRPVPYYVPPPHSDEARTFYSGLSPTRPNKLFFVGMQGLLYRSLIGEVGQQSDRDRMVPWLEVGIGMYMEHTMQGPAGFATTGRMSGMDLQALRAASRNFRVSSILHLPMYGGYYLMDDTATAIHWSASAMFVTWLLQDDNKPPTRAAFFNYVRQALGERKGDSSSLFDRAMGQRAEEMEEPWSQWLANKAGR